MGSEYTIKCPSKKKKKKKKKKMPASNVIQVAPLATEKNTPEVAAPLEVDLFIKCGGKEVYVDPLVLPDTFEAFKKFVSMKRKKKTKKGNLPEIQVRLLRGRGYFQDYVKVDTPETYER